MNLYSAFLSNKDRRIIKNAHYFPIYERYFARYVGRPVLFLEIGTGQGGSCRMWKHYFGPLARIVTIDIEDRKYVEESQIYVRTGDQSDPQFLRSLVEEFGAFDIVLDDGSHLMPHVNATFDTLYPIMSPTGVYFVEDLNTAYWAQTGGGLKAPTSFIERCKNMVDDLNARHTFGEHPITEFSRSTFSVAFYDMVAVIEKSPYVNTELLYLPEVDGGQQ